MIEQTLSFLARQLDAHLRPRYGVGVPIVQLSPPAGRDAKVGGGEEGVHLTLINLEREGTAANTSKTVQRRGDDYVGTVQPLNLNLVFLASVYYPGAYTKSLDVLSAVIAYFQSTPVFSRKNNTRLPIGIEKLSVEWRDVELSAMHNLWSALGSDYLPSAAYIVRMLVVSDVQSGVSIPAVTSVGLEED